jgi:hypothetical protein
MDGRFLSAFTLLPRQREVCGRVTKPLCLRHRLVLESLGSPFVDGSRVPSYLDVLVFSKVVSSFDMGEMMPEKPTKEDNEWARKMNDDGEVLVEQVQEAFGCIEDQAKWPIFWKKQGGKDKGVPWVLAVVCNLVKSGVELESAWTMPEAQAVWMNAAFAINAGAELDIVSEEDVQMQSFLAKMEAEKSEMEESNV